MENRRQLIGVLYRRRGHGGEVYLKLCGQTDLQLKGGTVPFFSFFFYSAFIDQNQTVRNDTFADRLFTLSIVVGCSE